MMDYVITIRVAINSLKKFIELVSHTSIISTQYPHLISLGDDLNKLLKDKFINDDFARLFCRRLRQLINYIPNDTENQCEFWTDIYEDLHYLLSGPNVNEDRHKWKRFLATMELAGELDKRRLQFKITFGQRKCFSELLSIHRIDIDQYLQSCVSLHSKVQVRNLIDSIDDLLYCTYQQTEVSLTREERLRLEDKLKCVEISFDCSKVCVLESNNQTSVHQKFDKNTDNNMNRFLPTISHATRPGFTSDFDIKILQYERSSVILGEQQCGKTTLVRWMTRVYSENILFGNDKSLCRIPILIRTNEFVEWLEQDPDSNSTLIDYIGKHTWFSQSYHHDDIGSILREFINHGHALILVDGLNAIPTFALRCKIVNLIKNFMSDYIRAPNFLSPFDDPLCRGQKYSLQYETCIEQSMRSLRNSFGNQIIITSRSVGYDLCPLSSPYINHWCLTGMKWKVVLEFASQWVKLVEQSIRVILLEQGIGSGEIRQEILMNRLDNILNVICISDKHSISPHIVSLFCMHVFTSSDRYSYQSPIEVYDYAVRAVLRYWRNLEPNVSEKLLFEVLTNLATTIYVQSSSSLIDEFDMKRLCYLVLKQCHVSNSDQVLHEYTNKIISLFKSDISLIAEQEFEVFCFTHISFQRYFAVQALIRESSIDDIVTRFFQFVDQRRLYESLSMAVGWISLKWSLDTYNHFCDRLIAYDTEYALPLGSLLFFDALKYIHNLPSKDIIFQAFNHLLEHPSKLISQKYLKSSQLPIELIIEWIQLNIINEKRLIKFCLCLLHNEYAYYVKNDENSLYDVSPQLFQQLWSFRSLSPMAELVIDQTLHKVTRLYQRPDHIFENKLYSYLSSQNIPSPNIHPLVFCTILALDGGLHFVLEKSLNAPRVRFSPKTMQRQSSMIEPIMEYLVDTDQTHATKVQILIKKYENILEKFSPNDTSFEIIDTFIALICLRGVSEPSMYAKFSKYEVLPSVLFRFKQISLHLRELYRCCFSISTNECSLIFEMESIINELFRLPNYSDEQLIRFLLACIRAWKQLGLSCLSRLTNFDLIQKININQNLETQFEYRQYIISQQQYDDNNHNAIERTEYTPFDLLMFVPQSLQPLFYRLIILSTGTNESLPLIVLLSECLMRFDSNKCRNRKDTRALLLLYPLCKEHNFENYISVLWWGDAHDGDNQKYRKQSFQEVKNHALFDRFTTNVSENLERFINAERERIGVTLLDDKEKDLHLFSSCLCLARLIQAYYRAFKDEFLKKNASVPTEASQELCVVIKNISNPMLQLIVLNMILRLTRPFIFTNEQINQLNREILFSLNDLLPNLPLLLSIYLFIQYYERLQLFPNFYQHFIQIIGKKFHESSIHKPNQECAYIALRTLNDIHLSYFLSIFEKQTMNLSNILHFNSTAFLDYFSDKSSFDSSDVTLLSSMYLIELSNDIQILEMYINKNSSAQVLPLDELDQLWMDPLKYKHMLTIEIANWITNYLKSSNRDYIDGIIERVSSCCSVEETAYEIISKWLEYRRDEQLKFFAYYATLFCIKDDSIEILNEMFDTNSYLHLKTIIKDQLELESVTSSLDSHVLTSIILSVHRACFQTSAVIRSKEILDALLEMERKRILKNNENKPSKDSHRSFLSIFRSCSKGLKHYLIQHLQDFNKQNQFENTIKEQYLIVIVRWITLEFIDLDDRNNLSAAVYECFMMFLHDQQIPLVQKVIIDCINRILVSETTKKGHVFMSNDLKNELEDMIDKTNHQREDLLAICLLAYGNCLLKFNHLRMNQSVSVEIQDLLRRICLTSTSEIISARAFICLVFAKNGTDKLQCSSKWLESNFNLPVERRYTALLQLTLYENRSFVYPVQKEIKKHTQLHPSTLVNKLLHEFYQDLCNKASKTSFLDDVPDYAGICSYVFDYESNRFSDAARETSFGDEEWKSALYRASKKFVNVSYLYLYVSFGEITEEFVEMLINVAEKRGPDFSYSKDRFGDIKSVSSRDVIENLFELFQLKFRSKSTYSIRILELLVYLSQKGFISPLDVHQQVSIATNNELYEYDRTVFNNDDDPFFCLMQLRKFEGVKGRNVETQFSTKKNIEDNFKTNIQNIDKCSGLIFEQL